MQRHPRTRRRGALWALVASAALVGGAAIVAPTAPAAADPEPASHEPLGSRPYMGWSSYSMQVYEGGQWITADQIMAQSDAMHTRLQEYGYEYINVDAGWNGGIDEHGRPVPSETLYPDGLQTVIDHVHDNGQKFGLYLIPGIGKETYEADLPIAGAPECSTGDIATLPLQQGDYWGFTYQMDFDNPCSQAYVDSIADQMADWGVDFIKFDSVTPGSGIEDGSMDARGDVAAWSQALGEHGIWLELSWAVDIDEADYWAEHAQGWRIDWDIECYCDGEALVSWNTVERLFPKLEQWWRHAGPDRGWNDLDSLNVGNGSMDGLTKDERRAAATLWAVSAAPWYLGNDLTNLDDYGMELLTNPEVIAVNQAGRPARPVATDTPHQVWASLDDDGSYTVAVFNLGRTDADITVSWDDLGLDGTAKVRDLWAQRNVGSHQSEIVAQDVPIHGARLFRVTPDRGSTITINDDDLRVNLDGDWTRNAGAESVATSQPLTVAVGDSSTGEAPTAPEAGPLRLNDDHPAISYQGSWNQSTGRGFGDRGDDVHWTETRGDSATYSFVGTGIDFLTETDDSQGDIEVYLDGQLVDTVSAYRPPEEAQVGEQVVYSVRDLPNGAHTIRLVHASGQFMLVDGFDVYAEELFTPTTAAFDKAAPADVTVELLRPAGELTGVSVAGEPLTGGDYAVDGDTLTIDAAYLATLDDGEQVLDIAFAGDHLDDVHSTATAGDAVEVVFTGTGIRWEGPIAPDQGEVEVYLDGELIEVVDTAGEHRLTGQLLFDSGKLRNTEHTLRLVMASGEVMRFDTVTYTVGKIR